MFDALSRLQQRPFAESVEHRPGARRKHREGMVARLHGESHSPIDAVGIAVAIGDLVGIRVNASGGIADVLAVEACLFHGAIELAAAGEADRGRGLEDDFVKLPVAAGVIGLDQYAAGFHLILKFGFRGI